MEIFPFTAVVSQMELKKSLLLCAVNHKVGGVLIRGEKGTAKSTLVRGLNAILPELEVPVGCAFNCDPLNPSQWCARCQAKAGQIRWTKKSTPLVTLPLNATEDRVSGSLDFETAVKHGLRQISPGLLASAHRGLLYVDEVNLLDDHLVDIILDAAAFGENRLEREGLSFRHPSSFMLIGTMNPEEGELRPQFLDRFGLSVSIKGEVKEEERVELMLRREAFDRDPTAFVNLYAQQTLELKHQLANARQRLPQVYLPPRLRKFMAELASQSRVAGHRADLFLEQASLALAALNGRHEVREADIMEIAPLVLDHRQRQALENPPPPPLPPTEEEKDEKEEEAPTDEPENQPPSSPPPPEEEEPENNTEPPENESEDPPEEEESSPEDQENEQNEAQEALPDSQEEKNFQIGETFRVTAIESGKDRQRRRGSGRRSRSRVAQKQGRYVKSGPDLGTGDLALDATLRAAAPYQKSRKSSSGLAVTLTPADIREKVREKRLGNYLFFTVDASGSMGARGRMAASKGAVMSLLLDAYQKRDKVCLISFRRNEALLNLPLTTSVDMAGKLLAEMPVGGRTPLSAGLAKTWLELRNALAKNPLARPIVVLITDGRANLALNGPKENPLKECRRLAEIMGQDGRVKYIVVDTEETAGVMFGLASELAGALGATYFKIKDLKAEALVDIVKKNL